MKTILKFTMLLLIFAGCFSCEKELSKIPFTSISQSSYNYKGAENGLSNTDIVIENNNQWNSLLAKMDKFNIDNLSEKDIDFSRYQIIAVFDKQHNNGGWRY